MFFCFFIHERHKTNAWLQFRLTRLKLHSSAASDITLHHVA